MATTSVGGGSVEFVRLNEIHAVGIWRNTLLVLWRQSPTLEALGFVEQSTANLLARHSGGIGVFGLAQMGMPMIGSAERQKAGLLLKRFGPQIRCVASVIEGGGFWTGTTRSVMTAIMLLARPPCPVKIFGSVADAARWQAPLIGCDGHAAKLEAAAEELRSTLNRRYGEMSAAAEETATADLESRKLDV